MGRKYASIHIYGEDLEKVLAVIENYYFDNSIELEMRKLYEEIKIKDPERYERIINHPLYSKTMFYQNSLLIIKSYKFISIYDEENSFESIQNRVKNLSSYIDYPILYISNFDGDVFLIGAYKSGKLITSGKLGMGLSEYGMRCKLINIDKLCSSFHLDKTVEIELINSKDNIGDIEDLVEEFLCIPLDLDIEEVESDISYVESFTNNRLLVFDKKIN